LGSNATNTEERLMEGKSPYAGKAYERKRVKLKEQYLALLNRIMPRVRDATIEQVERFVKVSSEMHDLDASYIKRLEQALLRNNIEVENTKRRVTRKRRIRANTNSGGD
jgi:hypothetical protein